MSLPPIRARNAGGAAFVLSAAAVVGASAFLSASLENNRFGGGSAIGGFIHIQAAGSPQGFANAVVLMWIAFFLALATARWSPRPPTLRALLWTAAIASLPLIFAGHLMSTDVFDYIYHARIITTYHASPYTTVLAEFPSDPFYGRTMWTQTPAVYGPLWLTIGAVASFLAELVSRGPGAQVLVFRLIAAAAHLGTGWAIYRIAERTSPGRAGVVTAAYLFNPLCLAEFPANAHNDSLMIFLAVAGILFDMNGRWAAAGLSFLGAALVKLYALPLLCLYLAAAFWDWQADRWTRRRLLVLGGLLLVAAVILYLPFGLNRQALLSPLVGAAAHSMTKSLGHYFAFVSTSWSSGLPSGVRADLPGSVRALAMGAVLLYCVAGAFAVRRRGTLPMIMAGFALTWCAIGSTWFQPWYATAPVALAAASGSGALMLSTGYLSAASFLLYFQDAGYPISNPPLVEFLGRYHQLLIFLPPLLMLGLPRLLSSGLFWNSRIRLDSDNGHGALHGR